VCRSPEFLLLEPVETKRTLTITCGREGEER
jgi:hypothetical protein